MHTRIDGSVLARFGHAISDPTRAQILLALRVHPEYPANLAEKLHITKQNMSNHLLCLKGCGLVQAIPEGRRVRYELSDPKLLHVIDDLLDVVLNIDSTYCLNDDKNNGDRNDNKENT